MLASTTARGSHIGHYRLLEKIGAGGMGEVYRAWDEHLQRDVAIKLLPPRFVHDDLERARLRREALALSKLNHPNIATVHDFATEGDVDFLVMEYVSGESVRHKLAAGPLPEPEAVRLGVELAQGMAAAHEQGVVHRDLKPENLRLTREGELKILDFGIAKLIAPESLPLAATAETVTLPREAAGTLPYMSPEQIQGKQADERTDIWAAGVLLYEMTTGKLPFAGSGLELVRSILQDYPPPPRQIRPGIAGALETVILKCLEKEPQRRYQAARELLAALEILQTGPRPKVAAQQESTRRWWIIPAVAACAIALVAVLIYLRRSKPTPNAPLIRSIAVLPLANLSGQADQDYLADGMTEELITDLSRIAAIKVISRTSCMRYKNTQKTVPEIARELDVDAVVEGSVLRVNDRVRITAQLLHGPADRHLWAGSYERDLKDVLSLQAELADRIAQQIQARLLSGAQPRSVQRGEVSPEAYDLFLRANYLFTKSDEASFRKRVDLYKHALQIDPNFAPAHAGLAFSYIGLTTWNFAPSSEVCGDAEREARLALSLDDQQAQAHTALADVYFYCHWNWSEAEREVRTAIDISPNYSGAHYEYAFFLALMRRFDEAIQEIQQARRLDPLSPRVRTGVGYMYYFARRYDEAVPHFKAALEMEPSFSLAHILLAQIYAYQGNGEAALRERVAIVSSTNPDFAAQLRTAFTQEGWRGVVRLRLERLHEQSRTKFVPPTTFAALYADIGEVEEGLRWLEKAYDTHDVQVLDIVADAHFDPLRDQPRFRKIADALDLDRATKSPAR